MVIRNATNATIIAMNCARAVPWMSRKLVALCGGRIKPLKAKLT